MLILFFVICINLYCGFFIGEVCLRDRFGNSELYGIEYF